jgi:Fe-S-cluster-containing dehydrogenase component/DMSO reductase anchor subunit
MEKNIFIFDENKCVGCHACVVGCLNENGFQTPSRWRNIHNSNPLHHPALPLFYLSIACNHCDEAPCMINCPTRAFFPDPQTGAITHDPDMCMGCNYCSWACPYDAPKFNPSTGIIEKCTFCTQRLVVEKEPACTCVCPTGALKFAKEELSLAESYHYSPVPVKVGSSLKTIKRRNDKVPEMDHDLFESDEIPPKPELQVRKISAREEWSLLAFSLLATFMASLYISKDEFNSPGLFKWVLPLFGILAGILSLIHLGRKRNAWKSLFNIGSSWLSREIFFFGFFFVSVFIDYFIVDIPDAVPIINALLMIISIDMLYRLATWRWQVKIHSAQAIFIMANLLLLIYGLEELFILMSMARGSLYALHKSTNWRDNRKKKELIITRLALPVIMLIVMYYTAVDWPVFVLLLITDVIDRTEFYNDLRVPHPQHSWKLPLKTL